MEKGKTKLGESYWNEKGYYQDIYDRLHSNLVPSSGEADTVHGELVRAISRLYYDYCNNGNINAVEADYEEIENTCYNCGGTGELEYDSEDDPEECEDCYGSGYTVEEEMGDPYITPYYQEMLDFLHKHLENKKVVDDLENYMLENYTFYRYDNESMHIYDKVVDEVVWTCLTTEDKPRT